MHDPLPLSGRRIALLETREAERLGAMLRGQGAEVVSCPTVRIVDVADPAPVLAWLGARHWPLNPKTAGARLRLRRGTRDDMLISYGGG